MKNERLLGAFGQIEDEFIEEADPVKKKNSGKKSRKNVWVSWGVTAACALVIVGIGAPLIFNHDGAITGSKPEEPELEGNLDTTSDGKVQDEAGVGETDLVTLTNMQEIRVRIDEMFPDGFRGTIEVGSDDFKEGEQITIVAQDNVTVMQPDGSIFDYDEISPNMPDSQFVVGSSVWVGFQTFDYVVGNGKYNQIFAYHVEADEVRENNGVNYGEGRNDVILEGEQPVSNKTTDANSGEQSASEEGTPKQEGAEVPLAQGFFNATILEISEDFMLVSCTEPQSSDFEEGLTIRVSLKTISSEPIPELTEGANVRILYIGDVIVTEDYVQTEKTVSIFLLDENNEVIVE